VGKLEIKEKKGPQVWIEKTINSRTIIIGRGLQKEGSGEGPHTWGVYAKTRNVGLETLLCSNRKRCGGAGGFRIKENPPKGGYKKRRKVHPNHGDKRCSEGGGPNRNKFGAVLCVLVSPAGPNYKGKKQKYLQLGERSSGLSTG